jgi:hypothetical protein
MKGIDILSRADGIQHATGFDVGRQGKLNQDPMHLAGLIELGD